MTLRRARRRGLRRPDRARDWLQAVRRVRPSSLLSKSTINSTCARRQWFGMPAAFPASETLAWKVTRSDAGLIELYVLPFCLFVSRK